MKGLITALLLAVALPDHAFADTAGEVDVIPFEQFSRILDDRKISFDADTKAVLIAFANGLDSAPSEITDVAERLRDGSASISFKALLPLVTHEDSQAVCAKLADHGDPLLRFIANAVLAGSGDSKAAKAVYGLIHNQSFSTMDRRLLKTWCDGIGIRAKTDNAVEILDHLTAAMSKTPKLKAGDTAPHFDTTTMSGRKLSSKQLEGKVVVLHFWATSCGPCMGQMPSHIEALSRYSNDEVEILFVSLDEDNEDFKVAVDKYQMPFNNVHDARGWGGDLARLFGVNSMPFDVIIDGNGKVVSNSIGDIGAAVAQRRAP